MPSKDLPDQNVAAEAKVSVETGLSAETARGFAAWAKANRLKALLAIGGVVSFLITAVVAGRLFFAAPKHRPLDELATMKQILQALDRRAFAEAQTLAKRLEEQGTLSAEEMGGPAFALGAVAAYEAENSPGKDRAKLFLLASRYLEQAGNRGFPANRNAEGLYLLGKSLCESGQIQSGRPVLLSALKISPQYRAEIYALLANVNLNDVPPKLEQALEQNSMLLADKKLSEAKQQEALLQRAQILLGLEKIEDCNAALDQISAGEKNPAVPVQRARVLIHEAQALRKKTPLSDDDQQKWREKLLAAIQTLGPAQLKDSAGGKAAKQAMYLTGTCYLELGDDRAALEQFIRTYNSYPDTSEGAAAGFQGAELYRRMGRDVDALGEYRRVLGGIADPESYNNPWLPLDRLKSSVLAAYQHYLGVQKYEFAMQIIRMMRPLLPGDQVLLLQAEAHGVWGQTLLNQADKGPRNKAESIRRLGREQFRRAGGCYAELANTLPANKNYTDQLWNSAKSYLQGQDFTSAARMFQTYLKNEAQQRHPQALAYLGESLLAAGRLDKALEMLKECVDLYPRDAAACRARLLAARAYEEKGDWRNAENMLSDNLNGDYLTPESKEWRDSLLVLGELLLARGRYAEAVRRLEEFANRYPDLPDTARARYLTANCYYKLAVEARDKLNKDQTGNSGAVPAKQIQELYSKALEQYKQVQETLAKDRDNAELTPVGKAILRNCYFAVGNVLFAQGDYEAAVKAYSTAANRYQNSPEVLEAYVQIASAYRNLNKHREAKNALQQAKFALGRIKPDAAFENTTNYNRKQWADRLDLLCSL
jgi:tetratricopeptide (TPR) repeat protein